MRVWADTFVQWTRQGRSDFMFPSESAQPAERSA